MLLLSKKVKVQLKEERKILYAEAAKIYGKSKSIDEVVKKKKEVHTPVLLLHLKLQE